MMRSRIARLARDESGASLIIALIVISVFSLIAAALLTEAQASVAYTSTVTNHEKKVYAADAGVALGIQQLQQHGDLCPDTDAVDVPLEAIAANGYDVSVSCTVNEGSITGGIGYAIITESDESDSLIIQSGSQPKEVTGPVHVGGGINNSGGKQLVVKSGSFSQTPRPGETYSCNASTDASMVLVDSGFRESCKAGPTIPTYSSPAMPAAARTRIDYDGPGTADCRIFYPGTYDSAPDLDLSGDRTNYFASGVYYFKSSFTFAGTGGGNTYFVGGEKMDSETDVLDSSTMEPYSKPSCASDGEAISHAGGSVPEVSGTGVQFLFGNNAALTVDNKSRGELFTRTDDGTSDTEAPTIMAVPPTWPAPWSANTPYTDLLTYTSGSDKTLITHGVVHAPLNNITLKVTNVVEAAVFGGLIGWKVELQSSNAAGTGLLIKGGQGKPTPRRIVVKATAPAMSSGSSGRQVVSTALVEIANDANRTVTVHSWRTRAADEDL